MTYGRGHAEWYDLFYAQKPYAEEAAFIARQFALPRTDGRPHLLDVACGTGGHALAFEALGFDVVGVDGSEAMVAIARRKLAAANSRVHIHHQDMRALDLGQELGAPFDAAVCLFDSIGHAIDDAGVDATLGGIRAHLAPGGFAAVEFWHGPAFLRAYERQRIKRLELPGGGEILRTAETEVDLVNQRACVVYNFYELRADGSFASASDTVVVRFFGVAEMARFLQRAHLIPVSFHHGFSESTVIGEDAIHVVALARSAA